MKRVSGNETHYFYEPGEQRGGTKIRLQGKGKHIEEITECLTKLGFREKRSPRT